jgi:hypothetical protein
MLYAGERFEVRASIAGIDLASLSFDVAAPCRRGETIVLPVHAHAERRGIATAFASGRIDSSSFLHVGDRMPLWLGSRVERAKRSYHLTTEWLAAGYRYRYQRDGGKARDKTVELPPDMLVHGPFSALGALRTWSGSLGSRDVMHVLLGRRLWRLDLHVAARETVWSGDESRDAVRIDGIARRMMTRQLQPGRAKRSWSLWVSDDDQRMPLRASVQTRKHTVELELTDYSFEQIAERAPTPCDSN